MVSIEEVEMVRVRLGPTGSSLINTGEVLVALELERRVFFVCSLAEEGREGQVEDMMKEVEESCGDYKDNSMPQGCIISEQ
jgi:hypothetical protein